MLPCTHPRYAGRHRRTLGVNGKANVNAGTLRTWFVAAAASLHEQRDYLTQLDAAIGDADHGTNMDRGFTAVVEKLDTLEDVPPGKVLTTVGSTLVSTVGGASGPLWGMALRRAGRALGDTEEFDGSQLADAFEAALEGIVELGAAQEGDKTMVDTLAPAIRALRAGVEQGSSIGEALSAALAAGEAGMKATVPLQAQKGRASYLGERSIGHQDPGATSTALILAALEQTVAAEK
jgi:phosphoenolpyruvate---glycerone phosphotransferase subunit DhaL